MYRKACEVFIAYKSLDYIFMHKEPNMGHRRWAESLKAYNLIISYHLGKENIAAIALSRKLISGIAIVTLVSFKRPFLEDMIAMEV